MAEFVDSNLGSELFEAVCSDDVELVERLIGLGADVNWQNPNRGNKCSLHEAANRNNVEIVSILISSGCNLNLLTKNKSSPLRLAKISCNNEIVRLLTEAGAEDIGKQKKEQIRKRKSESSLTESEPDTATEKRKEDEKKDKKDTLSTCSSADSLRIYITDFENQDQSSKKRKIETFDLEYLQRIENRIDVLMYDSRAMKLKSKHFNKKIEESIKRIEMKQRLTDRKIQQWKLGDEEKSSSKTFEEIRMFLPGNDNFLHTVDFFDSNIYKSYRSVAMTTPYDLFYDSRLQWKFQISTILRFAKRSEDIIENLLKLDVEDALNYAFLSLAGADEENFHNLLSANMLMKQGADINYTKIDGQTALHIVILKRKAIFSRWFLAQKRLKFSTKAYEMYLLPALELKAKDSIRSITWFICRSLNKQYQQFCTYLDVWPGYYCHPSSYVSPLLDMEMCIVAQYKDMRCEKFKEFYGIKVEWRDKDSVSCEGRYLASIENTSNAHCVKTSNRLIQGHRVAELFKNHSNLTIISPSTVKSEHFHDLKSKSIKSQLCIALYCRIKGIIPIDEQPFPHSINDIKTDVREGFCTLGASGPKDFQKSLKIGCCIGPSNDITSGTLGGFLEIDDRTCFITCAHILFNLQELSTKNCNRAVTVVQPTMSNSPDTQLQRTIGFVRDVIFSPDNHSDVSVDAALVTMTDRCPLNGKFSRGNSLQQKSAGYKANNSPAFNNGKIMQTIKKKHRRKQVIKFGAESGLTIGSLNLCETHVRMENRDLVLKDYFHGTNLESKFIMYHQYEVFSSRNTEFFVPGDSGAFVFMTVDKKSNDIQCIGMAIGQTSHNTCLVTPIGAILEQLRLPLHLKEFSSPMDNIKCRRKTSSSSSTEPNLATSDQLNQMFDGFMKTFKTEMQTVRKEVKDDIKNVKQDIDSISNRLACIEKKLQIE